MTDAPKDLPPEDAETSPEDAETGKARKERVLHTRVPAVLEQELKRLAHSLRVPVSNVVRAILEDALDAVDVAGRRAEGEIRGVAERLAAERLRLAAPLRRAATSDDETATEAEAPASTAEPAAAPDVAKAEPSFDRKAIEGAVGFTPMVLAHETRCAVTGRVMPAGSQAFFVLFAEPGRHAIVAPDVPPMQPT